MKKFFKRFGFLVTAIIALGIELAVIFIGVVVYIEVFIFGYLVQKQWGGRSDIKILEIVEYASTHTDACISAVSVAFPVIWIVTFALWYKKLITAEKDILSDEQKVKLFTVKNIIFIAVIALGTQLFTIGAMDLILPHFPKIAEAYNELMEKGLGGNPIIVFFTVVILAPLSEELVFRGVIMKKARAHFPFLVANLLQATLFSLFHFNIVQGAYAFLGGLIMGYVAYKYRSIKASILLHLVFNGLSFLLIEPTVEYIMVVYILIGLVLIAIPMYQIHKIGAKKQPQVLSMDEML